MMVPEQVFPSSKVRSDRAFQWAPLPEEHPPELVECCCERNSNCGQCAGLGYYYLFKPGRWDGELS